jgi:hypothetical protein
MKTKIKTVFYCSTCKKKGLVKWRIEQHEKFCLGNPENIPSCFNNCKHLVSVIDDTNEIHYEGGGEIHTRTQKIPQYFLCKCFNQQMYTKKALITGRCNKYRDHYEDSVLMPDNCPSYEFNKGTRLPWDETF